jgi:hypothetical protein
MKEKIKLGSPGKKRTGEQKLFLVPQTYLFSVSQHIYLGVDKAALPC